MVGLSRLLFGIAAVVIAGIGAFATYEYRQVKTEGRRNVEKVQRELAQVKQQHQAELEKKSAQLKDAKQANLELEQTIVAQEATIAEKSATISKQTKEINLLSDYIQFLNVKKRVARIEVVSREEALLSDQFGDRKSSRWHLKFQEFDQSGRPVNDPLTGSVLGNVVKVDAFTIQWEYDHPDRDLDNAHSLVFIRRLYGSDEPANQTTFVVDENGKMPKAYGDDLSPEALELLADFWDIANDPQRRDEQGISFIGLQAPGIELREGVTYELEVRQSGAPILKAVTLNAND